MLRASDIVRVLQLEAAIGRPLRGCRESVTTSPHSGRAMIAGMSKRHATIPGTHSCDDVTVSSSEIGVELVINVRDAKLVEWSLPARHARILATALQQAADHAEQIRAINYAEQTRAPERR